jgi:hypothetical protein
MSTQAMGPMAGFDWLKKAINLGRNNPKAVFGGAALLMLAIAGAMIVVVLLQLLSSAVFTPGSSGTMVVMGLTMLSVLLVMAVLSAGYLRLVDAVESGRPASATDVFHAFGDGAVAWRMIGFLVLLTLLNYAVVIGLLVLLAGDLVDWYVQTLRVTVGGGAPDVTGLPDGIGFAYAVMLAVGLVFYAIQAIGMGQVALRGRGVFAALGDGFAGTVKNLLPLLMLLVAYLLLCVVALLVVFALVMLFTLLIKVSPWLALLAVPLYLAALLAIVVVAFGVMYALWRDVCGGGNIAAAPGDAMTA